MYAFSQSASAPPTAGRPHAPCPLWRGGRRGDPPAALLSLSNRLAFGGRSDRIRRPESGISACSLSRSTASTAVSHPASMRSFCRRGRVPRPWRSSHSRNGVVSRVGWIWRSVRARRMLALGVPSVTAFTERGASAWSLRGGCADSTAAASCDTGFEFANDAHPAFPSP